jgi:hypothetical protein
VETGFQQAFLLISPNPFQALSAWSAPLGIGLGEIPMWKIVPASLLGWLMLGAAAMAQCTSIPNSFTNGTTADAGQVNANFSYLGSCAAPLASPSFTGNVGVGMSPTHPLDINGAARFGGGSGTITAFFNGQDGANYTRYENAGTVYGYIGNGAGLVTSGSKTNLVVDSNAALEFVINNNGVVAGMFGTDGSFLVGTTSNGGWSGTAIGEFRTTLQYGTSFYQANNNGGYSASSFRVDYAGLLLAGFYYSTSQVGSITTNGSATAYNTSSDARLKSNVVDLLAYRALRALKAYHPQEYLVRGKPGAGALAQDVERRMHEAGIDAISLGIVTRGDDSATLREGQPGFRQWGMDSAKMVPFVIATALDHEDRIKRLEAENAALVQQIRTLARTVASLEQRGLRQAASVKMGSAR